MTRSTTDDRTRVERLLGVVTDVAPGEAPLSLTLALNVFLLLTAYYIVKPVREALILALDSGAEYKSYMSAVIALALLLAVPAYGRFVDRLPRLRLVVGVTLFFASHLVLFFAASQYEPFRRNLGLVFFVWVGIFNMMVVAQLWSFANDLFDPEQGKRLFALVALGASLGAAVGSKVASWLVEPLGVYALLLVSAAVLVLCAFLFVASERLAVAFRRRSSGPAPAAAHTSLPPRKPREEPPRGAFALVVRHRYLLAIALFTLVLNWANTNGEYMFGKLVKSAANDALAQGTLGPGGVQAFIGQAYADFFFLVNLLGVLFQAFLVSRVVKYGSTGPALFVLPIVTLGSGLAVAALPLLAVLRVGKSLENATDYSLTNTVRQMLWLPTSREMKYKAKQAVDTFFVRLGDVSSALLVYVGAGLLSWSVRAFAVCNALLALAWLFLAWRIRREGEHFESPASRTSSAAPATSSG
ncbi:MAG TPA: MFS transporter [Polyangiaceae bacterium]